MTTDALPPLPDSCWPVDTSCCEETWDSYDEAIQDRAVAMAGGTLRMLTAYRVGGCPIVLRPCMKRCGPLPTWAVYPVGGGAYSTGWTPQLQSGQWVNVTCGCGGDDCSCTTVCEVKLPGEVGGVDAVWLDGVELDPSAYRVDIPNRLVRTDGECWPLCQDMNVGPEDEGAFAVHYLPTPAVDEWGAYAAGRLACEFAKACTTGKCGLPPNVVSVARQGVTMQFTAEAFPGGLTGLREVDAYIARWNPHGLKAPSRVWSPDMPKGRVTL